MGGRFRRMDWQTAAAIVAALAAVAAVLYGRSQAKAADRSADASEKSADAARRSAQIAERAERRQTERNDVVWTHRLDTSDGLTRWVIQNVGVDPALDVLVVATVGDEQHVRELEEVPGGGEVAFDLTDKAEKERERSDRTARQMARMGAFFAGSPKLKVGHRVHWRTPAGGLREQVLEVSDVDV